MPVERLSQNLNEVQSRIAEACLRSGRDPQSVRLIAVTKSARVEWVRDLVELGQVDLAENRPQQLVQRVAELPGAVRWHMIGHLQRNKVELVWPAVQYIHAVDSLRLWQRVVEVAAKSNVAAPQILFEVNISGEASKGGFDPVELIAAWPEIQQIKTPQIVGLMTMAPLTSDTNIIRSVFRGLRELRVRLSELSEGAYPLPELSMGMSGDYEIAVEEGATMVRVGSRLFEGLE